LIGADLNSMSVDKLWNLHAKVNEALRVKLSSQKVLLDAKLSRLGHAPLRVRPHRDRHGVLIRKYFRSIKILNYQPKVGPVEVSGPDGWQEN
jgi:hypothetical protein